MEFRSGVKSFYRFHNKLRLGIELFHLSNGGIADRNPGTEVAFISLSFPL
ncbi:acyloxyacyl hydrolase [Marinobacter azerbaijanicus]